MPDIVTAYNLLMAHDELASKLRAKKSELAAVKAGGEGVEQSEAYNQILTSMREPLCEAMRVLQQRIDKARSNPAPLVAQGLDVGGYIAYNEHILQAKEQEMQSLAQEAQKKVGAHALITAMGNILSLHTECYVCMQVIESLDTEVKTLREHVRTSPGAMYVKIKDQLHSLMAPGTLTPEAMAADPAGRELLLWCGSDEEKSKLHAVITRLYNSTQDNTQQATNLTRALKYVKGAADNALVTFKSALELEPTAGPV